MSLGRILFFICLAIPLNLAFVNCNKFEVMDSVANASLQTCVAKTREKITAVVPLSLCEDFSSFECERRVFRPGLQSGQSREVECVSIEGKSEICVSVLENRFDTEAAREGAEITAFIEGGDYNREEIQCWNTKIQKASISLIQAEAPTLSAALSSAISRCQDRGVL